MATIAALMAMLAAVPSALQDIALRLPAAERLRPLGDGERSFTQDVAHLLHCEARTTEAITLALLTDKPLLPDLHPERDYGRLVRLELLDADNLLDYFALRRAALLGVLGRLTESQWARQVRETGKQREESVYWLARTLALHEREHLDDLGRKLEQAGR
jgi:hypothetical protein